MGKLRAITRQRCLGIVVSEFGRRTGRFHLHGLLSGASDYLIYLDLEWRTRFGLSQFERLDPGGGATKYISKYCAKDANHTGTWDLFTTDRVDPVVRSPRRTTGWTAYQAWQEEEEIWKEIQEEKG